MPVALMQQALPAINKIAAMKLVEATIIKLRRWHQQATNVKLRRWHQQVT